MWKEDTFYNVERRSEKWVCEGNARVRFHGIQKIRRASQGGRSQQVKHNRCQIKKQQQLSTGLCNLKVNFGIY